ncbi:MAG: hypothetical protein IBJ18_11530 [Phycisphaerales bacterium]|nr:hypothetical protein [Phycisphaerales bacterium]
MHDPTASGNDYFKCDFCHQPWSEDRPMIEGHKGSLVCKHCLNAAYTTVVHMTMGVPGTKGPLKDIPAQGPACTMCLERREELYWQSPIVDDALICRRCIRQAVTGLERDPDYNYARPAPPPGAEPASVNDNEDEHEDDEHDH